MKPLEYALTAVNLSDQLKILEAIPPKEYPQMIEAIRKKREIFSKEFGATYAPDRDDGATRREEIEKKIRCLHAAGIIAHQNSKKLPPEFHPSGELLKQEEIVAFLAAAPPAWLSSLITSAPRYFPGVIHLYLKTGLVTPPPEGHSYYADLPGFILVKTAGQMGLAKQFLRDCPSMVTKDLHHTIRLVAQKGGVDPFERSPSQIVQFFDHENGGKFTKLVIERDFAVMKAVGELCAEGDFDIHPLLLTILETIADSQREFEARRVLLLHYELAPTPEQCLKHQSLYFSLLSSPHKAIVSFGIQTIRGFCSSRNFAADEFIHHVAPVFLHASNPLHVAMLQLILNVVKDHGDIAETVAPKIALALMNPNVKVQSTMLAFLRMLPSSACESVSDAIAPYADRILPSLKSSFSEWLGKTPPAPKPNSLQPGATLVESGERLEALVSVDDLAFVANKLLDTHLDPMNLELFLDGLARFAAENREKIAKSFKPLQKRALKFVSKSERGRDSSGCSYPASLLIVSRLILKFGPNPPEADELFFEFPPIPDTSSWHATPESQRFKSVLDFAVARSAELVESIRDGRSAPLLATPDFDLGFISPTTLLKRFHVLADSGLEPLHFDFIQAIARFQPCGSDTDYLNIPETSDEAAHVLRFLLSGEIHGVIRTPAWWLTAARTREPFGDFSKHPQLSPYHRENEPDWSHPAVYRRLSEIRFDWNETLNPEQPDWDNPPPPDHLYPLQHIAVAGGRGHWGSDVQWRYSFTPNLLDAVIARDLRCTYSDWELSSKAEMHTASVVMAELTRRCPPLRYTMQAHLLMALNSFGCAEREAGVDLFLQASRDGRLAEATSDIGELLSQLLQTGSESDHGVLRLSRMVPALREISAASPTLQVQLRDILLRGLEQPPKSLPKGFSSLLELLLDLVLAHPPAHAINLNTAWGEMLQGNTKSLASRISKASS